MAERIRAERPEPDGFVEFWSAGLPVKGEFHCAQCAYGVVVHRELPACPMCGGTAWEQVPWSPLMRAQADGRLDGLPL